MLSTCDFRQIIVTSYSSQLCFCSLAEFKVAQQQFFPEQYWLESLQIHWLVKEEEIAAGQALLFICGYVQVNSNVLKFM